MKLCTLRVLLWLIRTLSFQVDSLAGFGSYQWVCSPAGGFDHWFYTTQRTYSVCWVSKEFGFWPVIRSILLDSELLIGWRRWVHSEILKIRSEQYFCGPPLRDEFAAQAFCRLLKTTPEADVLAQTAASYRIADAMFHARLTVDPKAESIRHPRGCNCAMVRGVSAA